MYMSSQHTKALLRKEREIREPGNEVGKRKENKGEKNGSRDAMGGVAKTYISFSNSVIY